MILASIALGAVLAAQTADDEACSVAVAVLAGEGPRRVVGVLSGSPAGLAKGRASPGRPPLQADVRTLLSATDLDPSNEDVDCTATFAAAAHIVVSRNFSEPQWAVRFTRPIVSPDRSLAYIGRVAFFTKQGFALDVVVTRRQNDKWVVANEIEVLIQ